MSKLPASLFQKTGWDSEKNPVWLGSTLNLYRNFSLYKFPDKMTLPEMNGSLKVLADSFQKIPLLQSLTLVAANDLSPLDKELLVEHFECAQGFQDARDGQAFVIDSEGKTLITLHIRNHLQLHILETSEDLIKRWASLMQIEEEIGKNHRYAFSSRFGYLTASPLFCGTAFEARLILHIPALRHTSALGELLQKLSDEQIAFEGLEGTLGDLIGDFLILRNRYTLGVSEEAMLSLLQNTALKMTLAEKAARDTLKSHPLPQIKDFVGRSFGLLMHSYQLHSKEALDGLSGLKLGVDIGWVSGISSQKLSTLMMQQRRGHLTHLLQLTSSDPHELSHKRAEWLHEELKGITIAP